MDNVTLVPNKRRKRYSIEINEQAEVIVRTPWRASKKIINELIEEHQDWILRQKTKQQKINSALSDWHDPDTLYFRGKKLNGVTPMFPLPHLWPIKYLCLAI